MADVGKGYIERLRVRHEVEHGPGTIRIFGEIKNLGKSTVAWIALKAILRNFDGFSLEVDTLHREEEIPPKGTLAFAFPERRAPVNLYTCDVVVSKVITR